jgi:hypothetical protein
METAAIIALATQFTSFATAFAPTILALIQAAKVGASAEDLAKLNAAEAALASMNDALHAKIQGLT